MGVRRRCGRDEQAMAKATPEGEGVDQTDQSV